jgi:hypothetical protein
MKNLLLMTVMCLSLNVSAAFPEFILEDATGTYTDPTGEATVYNVEFGDIAMEELEFEVEKIGTSLFIQAFGEEIEYEEIPQALDDLETLNFSNIWVKGEADTIELGMDHLDALMIAEQVSKSVDLNSLHLSCNNKESDEERTLVQELLDSCLNEYANLTLDSGNLVTDGKETKFSDINLVASGNDLTLTLNAKGMKVKGTGEVYYDGDKVKIKIIKVKAGFFNITKTIFKELENIDSDKIIVNNPWIELLLE